MKMRLLTGSEFAIAPGAMQLAEIPVTATRFHGFPLNLQKTGAISTIFSIETPSFSTNTCAFEVDG
jgi:hypothetical protein